MTHAIKEIFLANLSTTATVHLDDKLLCDKTSESTVDRLSITVSGYDVNQLLAVPKLPNGSGIPTVNAVHAAPEDGL